MIPHTRPPTFLRELQQSLKLPQLARQRLRAAQRMQRSKWRARRAS